MSFIKMSVVAAAQPLKEAYYPFPRSVELRDMLEDCLTDYYVKAELGRPFEARGLLVTGKSRVGKSRELERMITEFNDTKTMMPNGKPGRIVQCRLWGRASSKDLATEALAALGYPAMPRATENEMWQRVHQQASNQGVIGIHFDEAQHAFTESGRAANGVVLNTLKKILKDLNCPMILILSGVPVLADYIEMNAPGEDRLQLRYLLKAYHFDMIHLKRDLEELNTLAFSYADKAGVDFTPLSNEDFYNRLSHSAGYRWGLVIEMLIEALTACLIEQAPVISADHFEQAFAKIYGTPSQYSPFSVPDFLNAFDPDNLMALIDRTN